ncbi:serine acetyltransferase [Cryobacterium arcticum]|uniref:serine O-acetyltransferase n=1 Tax=Cryobacterium arcticum TaxID=670052 RepID=UPI0012EE14EA
MKPTVLRFLNAASRNPGLLAVILFRVQTDALERGKRGRAERLRGMNHFLTGVDFVVGAKAGPGLLIHHPNGIVVGRGAKIGANCTLLQQVTLGERYLDQRGPSAYPTLEDGVTVGAGARLLGGIVIGQGSNIGANSVVLIDVPPGHSAVGSPARVLKNRAIEEREE